MKESGTCRVRPVLKLEMGKIQRFFLVNLSRASENSAWDTPNTHQTHTTTTNNTPQTTPQTPNALPHTTQHNTTQHNTTQHNTTQHNTTQHNTTQHNTTQHNTTQHNTTQHNTTQLFSIHAYSPSLSLTVGQELVDPRPVVLQVLKTEVEKGSM